MQIPRFIAFVDEMRRHVERLSTIEKNSDEHGNFSATTKRFRNELFYYLLDNPAQGPIIEVGTQYGGTTALLGYVGNATGRTVYALDTEAKAITMTAEACARADVQVTLVQGTLQKFFASGKLVTRPDLLFLDSDHSYRGTMGELQAIYGQPFLPRCIALHDFNYRQGHQIPWLEDLEANASKHPIAVDRTLFHFLSGYTGQPPIIKRIGAFCRDGTASHRDARGGLGTEGDFIEDYGTEGVMLFHP